MYQSPGLLRGLCICGLATSMFLVGCGNEKKPATSGSKPSSTNTAAATAPSGKIAYVNLDTLGVQYEFFKNKKADFEKKTASMEAEVERLARNFQNEYAALQNKAKAGTLSQAEGEAAEKKLGAMQQEMEARRQNLGNQLMKEQDAFNQELQNRLDQYLVKFNADKGYDFIMSYTKGGTMLYANPSLDITGEVVKFLNAEDAGKKTSEAEVKK